MTRMLALKAALAASVCFIPIHAFAQTSDDNFDVGDKPAVAAQPQTNNWVIIGGQYNSARSYSLGRYSGVVDPGGTAIGGFHIGGGDAWDSGGTTYWEAEGNNLGMWDRSFNARVGKQGTWGLTFYYQGIPYYASNNFQSILQSNGQLAPGIAPGSLGVNWTPILAANPPVNSLWKPSPAVPLGGSMMSYNLSTRHDIFGGSGKYQWGDWTISGAWKHDHKEGFQASSAEIGGSPSLAVAGVGAAKPGATSFTAGLVSFALPIDYDMDRYDVTAAWGNARMQAQLGYTYSQFTDNNTVFDATNPFNFTSLANFGTAAGNLFIPFSQMPSNSAHQFKGSFGYNFTPTTRLTANAVYGLEFQNDPYNSGTGDPANAAAFQALMPANSFNGKVQTFNGNVALTAQPIKNLDVRLAYNINDYDNRSTSNLYPTDTRSNTSLTGNGDCTIGIGLCANLPYSWDHQTFTAEAGYRILPQTKVTLNETFETMHRTFADTTNTTTNTVTAKVRSNLWADAYGALSYSHQDRDAHAYNYNATWRYMGMPDGEPTVANGALQNFLMYSESSRTHDDIKASIDLSPTHAVNASLFAKASADRYPAASEGLRNNHNISVGPDLTWQVSSSISATAYYTFQQIFYDQTSQYSSGGYVVPWTAKTTDSVHTVGANVDWQAIPDVLKFTLGYNLSYGDTAYALGDSIVVYGAPSTSPTLLPSLTMQPLPDVTSMLSTISLRGEYNIRPNMTVLFGYTFERFTYKDFMQGTSPTSYGNVLLDGAMTPNDSVHIVTAALRFRF